ncbi:hypothetical protein GCM10020331_011880 [Ectobacillus funiculus]
MVLGPTGMGKKLSCQKKPLVFTPHFFRDYDSKKIDPKNESEKKFKEALEHFSKEDYPEFHEMVNHINFISLTHEEKKTQES